MTNQYLCILATLAVVFSQKLNTTWILAADFTASLPYWSDGMPRNGDYSSWSLASSSQQTLLKIDLLNSNAPGKYLQIVLNISSAQQFDPELFQANAQARFIFHQDQRTVKQWDSSDSGASLKLMVNDGKLTLSGNDFYVWITLGSRYTAKYTVILALLAALILKTLITFGLQGRYTTSNLILPGLLSYATVFNSGVGNSIEDILFQTSWEHVRSWAYILTLFVYLPFVLKIADFPKRIRVQMSSAKATYFTVIEYLIAAIAIYFLFFRASLVAITITAIFQTCLYFRERGNRSLSTTSLYLTDVAILLFVQLRPIHPKQLALGNTTLAATCILIASQLFVLWFRQPVQQVPIQTQEQRKGKRKIAAKQQ